MREKKLCTSCDEAKDNSQFVLGNTKGDLSLYCKSCTKERNMSFEERNRDEMNMWGKGFRPKIRLKDWDQLE